MKKNNNIPLNLKEKNNSKISFFVSAAVLVGICLFFNQMDYQMIRKPAEDAKKAAQLEKEKAELEAATPQVSTASVIAVGDNLYHGSLIQSGEYDSGIWNYDHIYANVLDEIQAADVAIIDEETVFTNDHNSVSSYPSFATPTEVGDALVKAGFDVIETATNHIDDYGYDYMAQTFEFWKKYPEVTVIGTHETEEDANSIKVREVNGIKIAFLDYTYGTNNSGAGEGREYMIDIFDKDKVASDIQKAKGMSDCIIFVAHWGTEDEPMPNEYEKQWAAYLMQQGVDVIIGGHPHVLQPYGWLSDDQGNRTLIFYSLGNFVSTQQELPELLGGMGKFTIQKTVLDGKTTIDITEPYVDPLVMHYNKTEGEYGVYMLDDYTEEMASQHSVKELIGDEFTLENLKSMFEKIMSINVKPSVGTNLLNVKYGWDGSMTDKTTGNYVEDTESITYADYYAQLASQNSRQNDSDSYNRTDNYDSSGYDDSGYDSSNYDDSYYDSGY